MLSLSLTVRPLFLQIAPSCRTPQLCYRDPFSMGRKPNPTQWDVGWGPHRREGQQQSLCLLMTPLYSEHRWTQRRIFRQIKGWIQFIYNETMFDSFLTEALTCKSSQTRTFQKSSYHCKNDVRKVFICLYDYIFKYMHTYLARMR